MNSTTGLRFLRPYLSKDVPVKQKSIYIRFFNSTRCLAEPGTSGPHWPATPASKLKLPKTSKNKPVENIKDQAPVELRIKELENARALNYSRIKSIGYVLTIEEYQHRYKYMANGEKRPQDILTVNGVCSYRLGVVLF